MALKVGSDYLWLVIGDRCWGRGKTLKDAKAECRKAAGPNWRTYMATLLVYLVPPSTHVDEMGYMSWKKEDGLPTEAILVGDGHGL